MKDIRLQKLAKLLINYSLKLKEGEYVQLVGTALTEPLLKELYREAISVGAHPEVRIRLEEFEEILFKEGNEEQLGFISPVAEMGIKKYDAQLVLLGGQNTKGMSSVDPKKISMRMKSMKDLIKIRKDREAAGEFRWCGTQFPTHSSAQEGSMSLEEYEEFVFGAGLLHKEDPIAEWKRISAEQQKVVDYLDSKNELHIISKDTDLKMKIEGRKWVNCDGRVNFPDGEVYTGPVEDSVEGYIRFSYPGIYAGKEIEDIKLEFKEGKVVKASAKKGEELLLALLETDEGAKRLGEIAIGTNYGIEKFTKNMLFDEKIGGTVHAALGASIPNSKGKNESSIHWDMLCDMKDGGKIYADGELFYENGKFIDEVINKK